MYIIQLILILHQLLAAVTTVQGFSSQLNPIPSTLHRGHFFSLHASPSRIKLAEKDRTTISNENPSDNAIETKEFPSYGDFAKQYPFINNIGIATMKTAAADLLAQVVIAQTPITDIDWQRAFLFCAFGAIYLGGFQYAYQVNIFKKLFDVDRFTNLTWAEKMKDEDGIKALMAQTGLDLAVLTFVYLPTFYVFKASVFSGTMDPTMWWSKGIESYVSNFQKDEFDLIRVWAPADIVCFSVPLYLRLPVRHVVSFVWTAYLSFARGGH